MFAYCTFVRFVPPILNCFVHQTQSLMPFRTKKKSKLNKLCAKIGVKFVFLTVFCCKSHVHSQLFHRSRANDQLHMYQKENLLRC